MPPRKPKPVQQTPLERATKEAEEASERAFQALNDLLYAWAVVIVERRNQERGEG